MPDFVHLHVHSQFSVLDGQCSVGGLVDKAVADGQRGIALTDHGVMYGVKEFYNYVEKKNSPRFATIKDCERELGELSDKAGDPNEEDAARITKLEAKISEARAELFKPVIGCECYCARRSRFLKDKDVPDPYHPNRALDAGGWHLILLAKNLQGYRNLAKIVSLAWTQGQYYRPRIDKELLEQYREGLIVSSACLGGEIPQHIMAGKIEEAEKSILWFKSLFGDDFYLELQRHKTDNPLGNRDTYEKQVEVNRVLVDLAAKHEVKLVATNDAHFLNEEDAEAHDRLICLSTGKDLDDPNRMRYTKQEWLKTRAEMEALFPDIPEALTNTAEILDKVEFYSIDHKALMPDFPIPDGFENEDDYLRHLSYEGAKHKYKELSAEVRERLDFELETIRRMGFPGYFLIVQDFIAAARKMGVSVGPGRGSAAGSAVAYSLGITDIDPIKYDLLFERFLNPDRISMPDIDVDFDDDGRADVLRWVTEKYGKEQVAHIITYGTMATKSAIRDVGRVERLPLSETNRLAKLVPDKIPGEKKVTLGKAMAYVPELRDASQSRNPQMHDTMKYAQMLEGNVRNVGVHACGIIIGKYPISDVVPVGTAKDGDEEVLVTQYEGSVIEQTGLIKMDFLGLKTLSVIKEALSNIKLHRGEDVDIDTIPMDDPATFKLYSEGRTVGTFQFESAGMQRYLRELQPTAFEDLIAMNALYRPGPMDYISGFIARKHGREPIVYDLPEMERYLKDTYGITVYQEQVMLLSRELAGFTRGQSDELRKAMGKKLIDKMNALKVKFLDGGKKNGYRENILLKIWADWEKFASYAFNKSHATCYSRVAYQTAYLKANYPAEYMAGALSRNLSNIKEITKLMDECRAMGIQVLVPDVNESEHKFSVNAAGNIRFGLSAIKGVSQNSVEAIIAERTARGPFSDIYNFAERIDSRAINKKTTECLVLSGAFDNFGISREQYFAACGRDDSFIAAVLRYGSATQEDKYFLENSLFGGDEAAEIPKPQPEPAARWNAFERLNKERDLVGFYLSANPMAPYRVLMQYYCNTQATTLGSVGPEMIGQRLTFAGMITSVRSGVSKSNKPYAIFTVEDFSGTGEVALFGEQYVQYSNYCKEGLLLFVRASVQAHRWREGQADMQITSMELLSEDMLPMFIKELEVEVNVSEISEDLLNQLHNAVANNPGKTRLLFRMQGIDPRCVQTMDSRLQINPTPALIRCLEENSLGIKVR